MTVEKLMTVGELAKKVGVTVRTIQYYDQKGLLHPSKIGESNRRLYSEADEQALRRILVLKYLGLSLSDIADQEIVSAGDFAHAIAESQDKLSEKLLKAFERVATLNKLASIVRQSDEVDWSLAALTIERVQSNAEHFWDKIAGGDFAEADNATISREEVLAWHALMGEAIEAMQSDVEPSSQRAMELGARFERLGGTERAHQGLGRMSADGGTTQKSGARGRDFYRTLQDRTLAFLEAASAAGNAEASGSLTC